MRERRKLHSQIKEGGIVKKWNDFPGLTVVTVQSDIPLSISRIANSVSPQGQTPHLMILFNPRGNHCTIIPNCAKMEVAPALKLISGLAHELNSNDETARYGGTKWEIDTEKKVLRSPNHGFRSSLTLAEIIKVVGIKQCFREIKRMRSISLLPLPGQVKITCKIRKVNTADTIEPLINIDDLTPKGFKGKIEKTKKHVRITL